MPNLYSAFYMFNLLMQNSNNPNNQESGRPIYGNPSNVRQVGEQQFPKYNYQPTNTTGFGYKPYQTRNEAHFQGKERNKPMYSSTIDFSSLGNSSGLNSMGRFVNQDTTNQPDRKMGFEQNAQKNANTLSFLNDLSNQNQIIKTNNAPQRNNQAFDRFPAASLKPNLSTQQPNSTSMSHPSETPAEKKKREVSQIKKQLQEISKKINNRREGGQDGNNFRPPENRTKNSAVSQSLIFESNYTQQQQSFLPSKQAPLHAINELYNKKKTVTQNFSGPISSNADRGLGAGNSHNNNLYEPNSDRQRMTYGSFNSKPQQNDNQFNTNMYQIQTRKVKLTRQTDQPLYPENARAYLPTDKRQLINTGQNNSRNDYISPASGNSDPSTNSSFATKSTYEPQNPISGLKSTQQQQPSSGFKKQKTNAVEYVSSVPQSSFKKTKQSNFEPSQPAMSEPKAFKKSDFHVAKSLGKGMFGEVLLVQHKETGFICGMKVMEKKVIREEKYVDQIARELSIQFYLQHRNIAPLYGYFSDKDTVYLLIEYCIGGQLLEKLRVERRMNERDVAVIMRQVCEGVDYIHKQLIIHRDIKPENILFSYGVVKISDFGWAVYRGHGLRKTASGSPLYYPPEIVKGEQYDDKIDIWCIGMMTYECILGKIPFRVYTELDLGRIVSDEITFPQYVDVTDEAKDFILKVMKKKGEDRMEIRQMLRHPFLAKNKEPMLQTCILEDFRRVLG